MWKSVSAGLLLVMVAVAPAWGVEVGETLPAFAVRTFDGRVFSPADLAGRPALLVFWNTWCDNCKRELPEIDRLAKEVGGEKLAVLAVNSGINDSERKAREYWRKQGFAIPGAFDGGSELVQALGVRGVPTLFLVDARGVVRYKQSTLPPDMAGKLRQMAGS